MPPVPRVHAVVVHHRGQPLLAGCLQSLLASQGVELRVVVVANDCREDLPSVVESDSRVHVFRPETPLGFSAANNGGVAFLRGREGRPDYIFFVNDDTVSEADALSVLARHLEQHPECSLAGPRLMLLGTAGRLNSLGLNVTRTGEAWDEGIGRSLRSYEPLPDHRSVLAVTGSALFVRASALERLGGWEELYSFYYEDIDLCLRARAAGFEVAVVPAAVVHHALSATAGLRSDFKLFHTWRNRLLLVAIHWPTSLLLAAVPRLLLAETWRLGVRVGRGPRREARLQARAWAAFLSVLPPALARRRQRGPRREWTALLRTEGPVREMHLGSAP